MRIATRKMRSPLKWHGGKSYLARRIIALFPPHRVYVEPFLGGGSVLLNKPKAEVEVAGDLDEGLMNFWYCLQDPSGAIVTLANELPYDEARFETARLWLTSENLGCRALGFLVRNRFSRGGLGKNFAWSERLRGGQPGDVNGWETIKGEMPAIAERIGDVHFKHSPYHRVIRDWDASDALIYCDPPYLHETRTAKKAYGPFEMTVEQHRELLNVLLTCKGKVFLSGYRSELYDFAFALSGWTRHEFSMPNHSGQGKTKQRRVECLWESPAPTPAEPA